MTMVACGRCAMQAYDNDAQSSLAKLKVEDTTCTYFVEPKEYAHRCKHVANSLCPYMIQKIVSRPDWCA